MNNLHEILEKLLDASVIYDFEQDNEFLFMTVDYKGGRYFEIAEELLIDYTTSDERYSLVGSSDPLYITANTKRNYTLGIIMVNEQNKALAEKQQLGQWTCDLVGSEDGDENKEVLGKLNFQFVLSIPRSLTAESLYEMLNAGIQAYKQTIGKIEYFIFKARRSKNNPLDVEDVFPSDKNSIQVCLHPKLIQIIDDLNEDKS